MLCFRDMRLFSNPPAQHEALLRARSASLRCACNQLKKSHHCFYIASSLRSALLRSLSIFKLELENYPMNLCWKFWISTSNSLGTHYQLKKLHHCFHIASSLRSASLRSLSIFENGLKNFPMNKSSKFRIYSCNSSVTMNCIMFWYIVSSLRFVSLRSHLIFELAL